MKKEDLFVVEKVQLYAPKIRVDENFSLDREIPDSFGMYKGTGEWLGTVGKSYTFTQPLEIYELFEKALKKADIENNEIELHSYRGGRKLSFEVKLKDFKVNTKKVVGDKISKKLRFVTSYDGSTSNFFDYFLVRLACTNGMTRNEGLKSVKFRHTESQDQKFKDLFNGLIYALEHQAEVEGLFQRMADEVYIPNNDNNHEFLKKLLGYDIETAEEEESTRKINKWNTLNDNIINYSNELGNNKWAVLNAVTHFTNHDVKRNDQIEYLTFQSGKILNDKAMKILS